VEVEDGAAKGRAGPAKGAGKKHKWVGEKNSGGLCLPSPPSARPAARLSGPPVAEPLGAATLLVPETIPLLKEIEPRPGQSVCGEGVPHEKARTFDAPRACDQSYSTVSVLAGGGHIASYLLLG
jgi:hypothetical protein